MGVHIKKWIHIVTKYFDSIVFIFAIASIILIAFQFLSVNYAVVLRYGWGLTVKGLFDTWEYSILYMTFLGAAFLLKMGGHVNLDLLVKRLRPKFQNLLNSTMASLSALGCLALTVYGSRTVLTTFLAGEIMEDSEIQPPEFVILMVIPLGAFLLFIQFARIGYGYAKAAGKEEVTRMVDKDILV